MVHQNATMHPAIHTNWGVAFHTYGGKNRKGEEATGGPTYLGLVSGAAIVYTTTC